MTGYRRPQLNPTSYQYQNQIPEHISSQSDLQTTHNQHSESSSPNTNNLDPWKSHQITPVTNQQDPSNKKSEVSFLVELIESMKRDMKQANSEMLEFKKNISSQVSQLQPQINQQLEAVNLELHEFKRGLTNQVHHQHPQMWNPTTVHQMPTPQNPINLQQIPHHQWNQHQVVATV